MIKTYKQPDLQYEKYRQHMRKLADVQAALALMQWDQETYLPSKGSRISAPSRLQRCLNWRMNWLLQKNWFIAGITEGSGRIK